MARRFIIFSKDELQKMIDGSVIQMYDETTKMVNHYCTEERFERLKEGDWEVLEV